MCYELIIVTVFYRLCCNIAVSDHYPRESFTLSWPHSNPIFNHINATMNGILYKLLFVVRLLPQCQVKFSDSKVNRSLIIQPSTLFEHQAFTNLHPICASADSLSDCPCDWFTSGAWLAMWGGTMRRWWNGSVESDYRRGWSVPFFLAILSFSCRFYHPTE